MATYNVGLYCRLSREDSKDGKRDVSVSIEYQRELLERFIREKNGREGNWSVYDCYIDDDVSGTSFNRPGYMEMMQHIEQGRINCVVVKDWSRFGRNYKEAADQREKFAERKVRLIAVNEGFDSLIVDSYGFDFATPIKDMVNQAYCFDVSRKIRSTLKLMGDQGKFSNSRAPYGYTKSPDNKHMLVIDERVAHNIVRIFDLYLGGMTGRAIAELFNNEGILSPNAYFYHVTGKPNPYTANRNVWGSCSVTGILANPVYYGAISSGKREVISYLNKKVRAKPRDEWVIIEDMHEPIISKEKWTEAQRTRRFNKKENVRRSASGEVKLFTGLVKCADCGGNMVYQLKSGRESYRCTTYNQKGKSICDMHKIDHAILHEIVLAELRQYAKLAAKDEEKLIDRILEANNALKVKNLSRYDKCILDARNRIGKIDGMIQAALEKNVLGEISSDTFRRLVGKYEAEQQQLQGEVNQWEREQSECRQAKRDVGTWISRIKECLTIDELTRTIAVELIDRIVVSQMREEGGEKVLDLEIFYKFGLKQSDQVNPVYENRAS